MKRVVILLAIGLAARPALADTCGLGVCVHIDPPHVGGRPTTSSGGGQQSGGSSQRAGSGGNGPSSELFTFGHVDDRKDVHWRASSSRADAYERAARARSGSRSDAYAVASSRAPSQAPSVAAPSARARAAERMTPARTRADAFLAVKAAWGAALEATGIAGLVGVAEPPDHGASGMDVEAAARHLRDNSRARFEDLPVQPGEQGGSCARHVRDAIEADRKTKLDLALVPLREYKGEETRLAKDYGPALVAAKFAAIVPDAAALGTYRPRAGDVVVFDGFPGHEAGHMAMYDGNEWVSDFKQGSAVKRPHDGDAGNGFYVNENDHFVGHSFKIYRP